MVYGDPLWGMGLFMLYGALYGVWDPLWRMGLFMRYGTLNGLWGPLWFMVLFMLYGALYCVWALYGVCAPLWGMGPLHSQLPTKNYFYYLIYVNRTILNYVPTVIYRTLLPLGLSS